MAVVVSTQQNVYTQWRGTPMAAGPAGRGVLDGPLLAVAIYCLRGSDRRIRYISDRRLAELYFKQCPGLLSAPSSRYVRVRRRPFEAWLWRNIERIAETKSDHRQKQRESDLRRILDYATNGPHFHDPDHRAGWERASGYYEI